jgi:2-polyprenyl-3-methyl-5-hydroxy-6-metoxy-1,4-benzoquinol methylase
MPSYGPQFFEDRTGGSTRSATVIVPMILDLVRPQSVVDVGCGIGNWLAVFRECRTEECLGVDGDYVETDRLLIPWDRFLACDLTKPLRLDRRFDLAVSLEVAEHLPAEHAPGFVKRAPVGAGRDVLLPGTTRSRWSRPDRRG